MAKSYLNRSGYSGNIKVACEAVLLELLQILGEFRQAIVLVGGSVPPVLAPNAVARHVGTRDIDLALNIQSVPQATYARFRETLLRHGYEEGRQPFMFFRGVEATPGEIVQVEVDFLAGEYGGTGKSHRTQRFDDVMPRKARGCDLAFDDYIELELSGELPGGGRVTHQVKVAGAVSFLVMKSFALADRLKAKDAYDINFVISNYPGGLEALVAAFEPHLHRGLVKEGLSCLRRQFESVGHSGPHRVAEFEELDDREEIARLRRDAYERVSRFLAMVLPQDKDGEG